MKFFKFIDNLILKRQLKVRKLFNRVLPTGELFSDRWEKAKLLGFGNKSNIYDSSYVYGDVAVGENTWIGPFTILDGTGGLKIGNNSVISAGVHIYTHDSSPTTRSNGAEPFKYGSVVIGDNCYIGPNAVISQGVILGDHCIVGANSFVNKSFPSNSKIAGTPAKILE